MNQLMITHPLVAQQLLKKWNKLNIAERAIQKRRGRAESSIALILTLIKLFASCIMMPASDYTRDCTRRQPSLQNCVPLIHICRLAITTIDINALSIVLVKFLTGCNAGGAHFNCRFCSYSKSGPCANLYTHHVTLLVYTPL